MKILFFLSMIFLSNIELYAQKQQDVIVICHTIGWGNGDYYTLIGMNDYSINQLQSKRKINKLHTNKYVVGKKCFEKLKNYIISNCSKSENKEKPNYENFRMQIFDDKDINTCYIESRKEARPYFEKLIKWMKITSNDDACNDLIEFLINIKKGFDDIPPGLKATDIK